MVDDDVLRALTPGKIHLRRDQAEPPTTTRLLFLSAVMELFSRGMDTDQISIVLEQPEYNVERALHDALAHRRKHTT